MKKVSWRFNEQEGMFTPRVMPVQAVVRKMRARHPAELLKLETMHCTVYGKNPEIEREIVIQRTKLCPDF